MLNPAEMLQAAVIAKRDLFTTLAESHFKNKAAYAHLPIVEAGSLGRAEAYKEAAYDMALLAAWSESDPKVKLDLELRAEWIQKLS